LLSSIVGTIVVGRALTANDEGEAVGLAVKTGAVLLVGATVSLWLVGRSVGRAEDDVVVVVVNVGSCVVWSLVVVVGVGTMVGTTSRIDGASVCKILLLLLVLGLMVSAGIVAVVGGHVTPPCTRISCSTARLVTVQVANR
jgi:hypothetical protein